MQNTVSVEPYARAVVATSFAWFYASAESAMRPMLQTQETATSYWLKRGKHLAIGLIAKKKTEPAVVADSVK